MLDKLLEVAPKAPAKFRTGNTNAAFRHRTKQARIRGGARLLRFFMICVFTAILAKLFEF